MILKTDPPKKEEFLDIQYFPEIEISIDFFNDFIREIKKVEEKYRKRIPTNEYEYEISDPWNILLESNIKNFYESVFISIYFFLEKKLKIFCRASAKYHENSFNINNRNRNEGVLEYCLRYLDEISDNSYSLANREMSKIIPYSKLRNHMAHSHTNTLDTSIVRENLIAEFLRDVGGVELAIKENSKLTFEIKEPFVLSFLNKIELLFQRIYEK